ncbi:hypothetical protein FAES_3285 [Fibrella aestuarina BUZ 2]|uniref:Uncharacterized protein n=1 Tax=Fibrella aestuarina BUZ 2 TaxID=1166018 RepID=I0KAZ1_9BACT|nr:hypothetical protein [Fibrella aestuarina]CCH01294.1 hypothetical protein FAES_3285 [Fibrella aestuarina BUZ 2]
MTPPLLSDLHQQTLKKLLASLTIPDKPAYLVVGLAARKAEVLVKLAITDAASSVEEDIAHTRREQAAICFPDFDRILLYRRNGSGTLDDITN